MCQMTQRIKVPIVLIEKLIGGQVFHERKQRQLKLNDQKLRIRDLMKNQTDRIPIGYKNDKSIFNLINIV